MRVQKKLAVVAVAVVMAMVAKAPCRYPNGCVRAALTRSLSAGYARAKPQVGSRLLLTATTHLITPHRPCYASCGHRSMPSLPRLHHPVRVYKYHPPLSLFDSYQPPGLHFCLFRAFISRLLPTMFSDTSIAPLQCYLRLFSELVLYHEPKLSLHLEEFHMTPEVSCRAK